MANGHSIHYTTLSAAFISHDNQLLIFINFYFSPRCPFEIHSLFMNSSDISHTPMNALAPADDVDKGDDNIDDCILPTVTSTVNLYKIEIITGTSDLQIMIHCLFSRSLFAGRE
jgi:hypothetical protein